MTGPYSKATKVLSVPMLKPAEPALQKFIQQVRLSVGGCGAGGAQAVCPSIPLSFRGCGSAAGGTGARARVQGAELGVLAEAGRPQGDCMGGNPRQRLTLLEAWVGAGPLPGQHPEGAQSLAVGSQAGVGAGTLGGKRKPQ